MAGWKPYVDMMMGDKTVMVKSGIYDHDGNPWAVEEMDATPEEIKKLVMNYEKNDEFYTNGCHCGVDGKYTFLRKVDDDVLVFKRKLDCGEEDDRYFLVMIKTGRAACVGLAKGSDKNKTPAINLVKGCGNYLKDCGY